MEELLQEKLGHALANLNWFYALVAVVLGALHSMEPGHGKALVSIYFVGRKRSLWDVLLLALIVTFTHTFSVIVLAVAGTLLAQAFWHERLMVGVEIVGGLGVLAIGATLWLRARRVSHERHFHTEAQAHDHDCGKAHGVRTMRELFSVGVVAGLAPCPAGVAVLLVALTTRQLVGGLVLTLAFSFGVGLLIFCVGVVMWRAMAWTERFFKDRESLILKLPQISSLIILLVGLLALGHGLWDWLAPH
jgi:ABC-type nickel/cobalt efflux system permease component RcnA